jgi:hypothetical protein
VADLNGDGKLDLAVANLGSNNVTILLGNDGGGFTPAAVSNYATGDLPNSPVVADLNGDGYPDLAVDNLSDGTVTVLLGNGSGGFSASAGSPFAAVVDTPVLPWRISMETASRTSPSPATPRKAAWQYC